MAEFEVGLTSEGGTPNQDLVTVVFDSDPEYVRFVEYVFSRFDGRGLELTNVPIVASVCVRPWLLQRTQPHFAMHTATEEEVEKVRTKLRASGRKPFDLGDIKNFYVPGL